jgi:inhibitor of cysteine peptidase
VSDVETRVGEEFEIELESVPTSGFRWQVAALDAERLRLLADDEIVASTERIGGAAVHRFRFQALAPGEAELRLALSRPWESKPPAEEREFRVTVHG